MTKECFTFQSANFSSVKQRDQFIASAIAHGYKKSRYDDTLQIVIVEG